MNVLRGFQRRGYRQKKDVKDVPRTIFAFEDAGMGARVDLLSNLNIERNATYRRNKGSSKFGDTSDRWDDEVYGGIIGGTKVEPHRLEPATTVGDCDSNAYGVDKFQVAWNFHAKRKFIESKGNCALKGGKPLASTVVAQAHVHILGSASPIGKPQFERRTALEVVVGNNAFVDRSLKGSAYSEKRDPVAQPEFVAPGFSRHSVENLVKPLTRHAGFSIRLAGGDSRLR